MRKSDLIVILAERTKLTQKESEIAIKLIFEDMTKALKDNDKIEIRGFGNLTVRNCKPYIGRNPKSGKSIEVKDKRKPFFKAGRELKGRVDK